MKSSLHRLIPFLPLFCNCKFWRLSLIPRSYPGRLASRNSTLHSLLLFYNRLSLSLMLRPTVSRPVCLGIKHPSGAYDQIFFSVRNMEYVWQFLIPWVTLSDERMGLSFVCAAGPCQRSLSRVLVPWDFRPYFTVSDLRLPFLSPPTTRRITVEVFDPASTRVEPIIGCVFCVLL
jgi:hypothetical protein